MTREPASQSSDRQAASRIIHLETREAHPAKGALLNLVTHMSTTHKITMNPTKEISYEAAEW
jgi:hypothetical protein